MRGGGVVFGPNPRSYDFKINKRELRAALRGALTLRVAAGDAVVVDDIGFDAPKTKRFKELLAGFGAQDALVVMDDHLGAAALSARNLPNVTVLPPVGLNVFDVLHRSRLIMTKGAVEAITARLGDA
jgi:large subunit ribosomal protein L4